LTDRYSERKESAEELSQRVNQRLIWLVCRFKLQEEPCDVKVAIRIRIHPAKRNKQKVVIKIVWFINP
jgi:hypothetical protein